jgi:hypothetical protein
LSLSCSSPDVTEDTADDADADSADAGEQNAARYRLHEWGVITLEGGAAAVHGPAPEAVDTYDRKPVIYLYPDQDMRGIDITVRHASGEATETWPPIAPGPSITWDDLAVSRDPCEATPFPSTWDYDPGAGTCEACALGTSVVEDAGCIVDSLGAWPAEVTSRLLFYAGRLASYSPPLRASAALAVCEDDPCPSFIDFDLANDSSRDIENVWLIYRRTVPSCEDPWSPCPPLSADIAFDFIDRIEAGEELSRILPVATYNAPIGPDGLPAGELPLPPEWLGLDSEMRQRLAGRGLTDSEAGALLAGWTQVFFGLMADDAQFIEPLYSNGAFLIYFMDREDYDAVLVLTASPPPSEIVRVGLIYQKLID